jgi:hypothetical protein
LDFVRHTPNGFVRQEEEEEEEKNDSCLPTTLFTVRVIASF